MVAELIYVILDTLLRYFNYKNMLDMKEVTDLWHSYLSLRDSLYGLREAVYADKLKKLEELRKMGLTIATIIKPIMSLLAQWAGSAALNHSHAAVKTVQNLGKYRDNPTHTQLAKDDDHNDLHMLAAQLAIFAVEDVGKRWIECRKNPIASNKLAVKEAAKKYFVHPANTNWMDAYVKQWAKNNPQAIKSAK
ncbi:hypothetical protein G9F32_13625 [Acinetobacter sp. 194]|uniref:HET-C-related protein n=1 Tax=Acinetobacter shaoyimingii TaxID=2715164 RepID=UPI001407300B|nr:HET-C-related protein [Acinetobacter shaoyimingii]NHB59044.1 hypothetical protein [Acinetobacter shaoyimingii]